MTWCGGVEFRACRSKTRCWSEMKSSLALPCKLDGLRPRFCRPRFGPSFELRAKEIGASGKKTKVSIFVQGLGRAGKRTFACPRLLVFERVRISEWIG